MDTCRFDPRQAAPGQSLPEYALAAAVLLSSLGIMKRVFEVATDLGLESILSSLAVPWFF
ncbi:MAG: hypothetical protein IMW99_01170 [Firmicutes bacterium]|nr:hypothetical protein [Bacillota bacterium]